MAKLTKREISAHHQACELLAKDRLSEDDRWFVLENWKESATHINSAAGAFFTPPMLARDFAIEVGGPRVIDLCAGIGTLAFMAWNKSGWGREPVAITCIESNPDYIAVGRKVLPEAEWIQADIFDLPANLGSFDFAISNPPFGSTKRTGSAPRYQGRAFEYHVIDIASDLARYGVFIVPLASAPFKLSGQPFHEPTSPAEYERFKSATGIELGPNCGIDTEIYRGDWNGVAPTVEIVLADFEEVRAARLPAQASLFDLAGAA